MPKSLKIVGGPAVIPASALQIKRQKLTAMLCGRSSIAKWAHQKDLSCCYEARRPQLLCTAVLKLGSNRLKLRPSNTAITITFPYGYRTVTSVVATKSELGQILQLHCAKDE